MSEEKDFKKEVKKETPAAINKINTIKSENW